jgi:uridylate kinase
MDSEENGKLLNEVVVINIGGSLLSPTDELLFDYPYISSLLKTLTEFTDKKFILIPGGGRRCRNLQNTAKEHGATDRDLDWIGVAAINVHAELMKFLLKGNVSSEVIRYDEFYEDTDITFPEQFMVTSASTPGRTSDYNGFVIAKRVGAKRVISISNIKGIYTADPKKVSDAQLLEELTWDEYFNVIGEIEHSPGSNIPIDPVAAKYAQTHNLELLTSPADVSKVREAIQGTYYGSRVY